MKTTLDTLAEARAQCYREAAKLLRVMSQIKMPLESPQDALKRAADAMDKIAEGWER